MLARRDGGWVHAHAEDILPFGIAKATKLRR